MFILFTLFTFHLFFPPSWFLRSLRKEKRMFLRFGVTINSLCVTAVPVMVHEKNNVPVCNVWLHLVQVAQQLALLALLEF